ncbi:MAG: hypothetical protein JXA71_00760 [Chitinispirillaceae bacterium]|nr:hypothetical protein [Chitinispirillaceae bacterium]
MTLIKGDYICQECLPITTGAAKPTLVSRLFGTMTKFLLSASVGLFIWIAVSFAFSLFEAPAICFLSLVVLLLGCGLAGIFFFDQVLEKGFGYFCDTFDIEKFEN